VFEQVEELVREHGELEKQLADPSVHADQNRARTLGRRYAELGPVVATYTDWKTTAGELEAAR
jgi:peptide chain release factor 1